MDATEDEATDEEVTERPPAERDLMFREAQGHYLSNDWVATEQLLLKLLKQDARDVEGRLMLATLVATSGTRHRSLAATRPTRKIRSSRQLATRNRRRTHGDRNRQ